LTADLHLMQISLVAGGTSAVAMVILWSWLDLPSLPQAIGASLAVLDRDFGTVRERVLAGGIFCFSRLLTDGGLPAEPMPVVERPAGIFIGALMLIAALVLSALHRRWLTPAPNVDPADPLQHQARTRRCSRRARRAGP